MTTYKGTAVSAGIAQGKLLYAESSTNKPEDFCRVQITDSEAEIPFQNPQKASAPSAV